jgi:vacuolar-type H+-ATPase subunit H
MDYDGGYMDEERTLLQQIRDKEHEFSKNVETVKQETDAQIGAAKALRENALVDAELTGKNAAEELFQKEKQKTETEIERMKKASAAETEGARIKGEKNLQSAVEKIVGFVIME